MVDPSRSRSDEQRHWARNWSDFIDVVERRGAEVDFNVALTTTDFEMEAGRFLPTNRDVDGVLSFSGGAVPRDAFIDRVTVGASRAAPVRALDAMYGALSPPLVRGANAGFLRPEPALSLVVVTDGDDASEQVPDFVMNYLLLLKGAGPVRTFLSTVSGGSTGCASDFGSASPTPRLAELADIYGGAALSICDPDWGRELAVHLLGGPDTWAPTRLFLSEEPVEGTLEAFVDGERWPSVDEEGRTRWQYDAGRNAVAIWERARPESGSIVVVRYVPTC